MLILYRVAFLTKRSSQGKFSLPTHCYNLLSPKQFFFLWRMIDVSSEERQVTENVSLFKRREWTFVMHQSIPASTSNPPPLPRASAGHLPALSVPGVGHLQILRSRKNFAGKTSTCRLAHLSRTGKDWRGLLRHVLNFMHAFFHCLSQNYIAKLGAFDVNQRFFGYWVKFLLILFEEHPFTFIKLLITVNFIAHY